RRAMSREAPRSWRATAGSAPTKRRRKWPAPAPRGSPRSAASRACGRLRPIPGPWLGSPPFPSRQGSGPHDSDVAHSHSYAARQPPEIQNEKPAVSSVVMPEFERRSTDAARVRVVVLGALARQRLTAPLSLGAGLLAWPARRSRWRRPWLGCRRTLDVILLAAFSFGRESAERTVR